MSFTDEQVNARSDYRRRPRPVSPDASGLRELMGAIMSADFTAPGEDPVFWTDPATAPENVASDLEAAATPITPDPAVKPKAAAAPKTEWDSLATASGKAAQRWRALLEQGYNYDEAMRIMAESSPAYRAMLAESPSRSQRFDARMKALDSNLADAYGHNAPAPMGTTFTRDGNGSAYGAMTDFGGGQTAMVDGVEVPVFDLGDGKQRYRLGDVKRAQEAAREAEWLAGHRKMVAEDIAKYGHYSLRDDDPKLTPEQREARVRRSAAEKAAQNTPYMRERRRGRLHAAAGIPEEATEGMGEEEVLRMQARNRQAERDRAARDMITRRAQLQRNPMEYLGRDDINDTQREVVARHLEPVGRHLRGEQENDARIRVAEIQAAAHREAAAAQRDAVAAEAAARREQAAADAAARAEDARKEREFHGQQNDANRTATDAARRADLDERVRQHEEQMLRLEAAQNEARLRHEQQMAQMTADREAAAARAETESARWRGEHEQNQTKIDAALKQQEQQQAAAEREMRLGPMRQKYGPGVDTLASGIYDTAEAEEALRAIAAEADHSWTGFYNSDAIRMDAILFRIGINDPAVRSQLVAKHGLGTMGAGTDGGRSGVVSGLINWGYGDPQYPTRTPAP